MEPKTSTIVTQGKVQRMTDEKRTELMAKKPNEKDIEQILKKLKSGASLWEVTESFWNFPFDHNDRRTWVFYSRINALRHKHNIPTVKLTVSLDTKLAINGFVKRFGEQKLVTLLKTNK